MEYFVPICFVKGADPSVLQNYSKPHMSKTQSEPSMAVSEELHSPSPDDFIKGSTCDLNLPSQKKLWVASPIPVNSSRVCSFFLLKAN